MAHVLWYADDSHTSSAARVCTWSLFWLTPLRELLEGVNQRFSKYFEQMKCAGEVGLVEHEVNGR